MAELAESARNPAYDFELWESEFYPVNEVVVPELLAERRRLTEVDHILEHMGPDGSVPEPVRQDITTNLETGVYENAMPSAVSITTRKVEHREDETGRREKVLMWLGKTAVESVSGYDDYYFSQPAKARGKVEVREARYSQEHIRASHAQVFLSPKMSRKDAPVEVAKAENLYHEDALRVSYPITNSKGEVIGQRLEALLVTDIPLKTWVAMLKDPNNIFGKSFDIKDEDSALSIMELFDQMELPIDAIPEGPVALVSAVTPYIEDIGARLSVQRQVGLFRHDQDKYNHHAKEAAKQWFDFELELARSLNAKAATIEMRRFIIGMQERWNESDLKVINAHDRGDTNYRMSRQLAAVLENGKRIVLSKIAATVTDNESALAKLDDNLANDIRDEAKFIDIMRANGATQQEIATRQAQLERRIAGLQIEVGGGCNRIKSDSFSGNDLDDLLPDGVKSPEEPLENNWSVKNKRKWGKGVCQVKTCPSPKPTEVGPCSVCRHCQAKFDAGEDPTKQSTKVENNPKRYITPKLEQLGTMAIFESSRNPKSLENPAKNKKSSAFALAS